MESAWGLECENRGGDLYMIDKCIFLDLRPEPPATAILTMFDEI